MTSNQRCQATTAKGNPCTRDAGPDGWCPDHDPMRADERIERARKGGHAHSKKARLTKDLASLKTVGDMQLILFEAFLAVAQGTKEPRVLTALATGARAILDIAGVVTYDEQLADMRARLADLEARRGR